MFYKNQELSMEHLGKDRYIVIEESISNHCCFKYTIVDTQEGKESYGDYWKKTMCETFEHQEAIHICAALNKQQYVK